jgi:hypothetical protein
MNDQAQAQKASVGVFKFHVLQPFELPACCAGCGAPDPAKSQEWNLYDGKEEGDIAAVVLPYVRAIPTGLLWLFVGIPLGLRVKAHTHSEVMGVFALIGTLVASAIVVNVPLNLILRPFFPNVIAPKKLKRKLPLCASCEGKLKFTERVHFCTPAGTSRSIRIQVPSIGVEYQVTAGDDPVCTIVSANADFLREMRRLNEAQDLQRTNGVQTEQVPHPPSVADDQEEERK